MSLRLRTAAACMHAEGLAVKAPPAYASSRALRRPRSGRRYCLKLAESSSERSTRQHVLWGGARHILVFSKAYPLEVLGLSV